MEKRLLLYLFIGCTLVANLEEFVAAKVRHYKFEVAYIYWSPDCEERMMIGINGRFPGPTIRAKAGDTIVVKLKNSLPTEGVVIHWHGIKQLGTPWADGTASISQCAVNPHETFVYRFQVDKAGTYFYHGHYGMQRAAGLYGSLIVDTADGEEEPFHYDGELSLLLSDWWHESVHAQMLGLTSIPFRWVGEPQVRLQFLSAKTILQSAGCPSREYRSNPAAESLCIPRCSRQNFRIARISSRLGRASDRVVKYYDEAKLSDPKTFDFFRLLFIRKPQASPKSTKPPIPHPADLLP